MHSSSPGDGVSAETTVSISSFNHERDKKPKPRILPIGALFAEMTDHRTAVDKKGGRLWSPIVFDGPRKGANAVQVSLLVFDLDDGTPPIQVLDWLEGLHVAVASTHKSTPDAWRLRVMVELVEPIPAAEYRAVWDAAVEHLLRGHVDGSTYDLARMFYLPTHPPNSVPFAQVVPGLPLDWKALPKASAPPPRRLLLGLEDIPGLEAGDERKRSLGLLRGFAEAIAEAPKGERHKTILAKARAAGGLRQWLDYDEIMSMLLEAADTNGSVADYGEDSVRRAIEDGISYGVEEPWSPAQLGEAPQAKVRHTRGDAVSEAVDEVLRARTAYPDFPLDTLPEVVQAQITASSLPAELLAAWYLAAIGTAVGGQASVERPGGRIERGNLWFAVIAESGYGKSAARYWAFRQIDEWDAQQDQAFRTALKAYQAVPPQQRHGKEYPKQKRISRNEFTVMGVLRALQETHSLGLPLGELDQVLTDIDATQPEGRRNATRMIHWWDGEPISLLRVGTAKGGRADVDMLIPRPTVVIVGNVQPDLLEKLGGVERGLRARWLHFAPIRAPLADMADPDLETTGEYRTLIYRLLRRRETERLWVLDQTAAERYRELDRAWTTLAGEVDDLVLETMLRKAGIHALRLAMVLAEASTPDLRSARPRLTTRFIDAAARIIEYTLQVADAAGGRPIEALTYQQQKLNEQAMRVVQRIERVGKPVTDKDGDFLYVPERDIYRNNWAGIPDASHAKKVIDTIVAKELGKRDELPTQTKPIKAVLVPVRKGPTDATGAPENDPTDPPEHPPEPDTDPTEPPSVGSEPQSVGAVLDPQVQSQPTQFSRARGRAQAPNRGISAKSLARARTHPAVQVSENEPFTLLQGEPLDPVRALVGPIIGGDTETTGLNPGINQVRLLPLSNGRRTVVIDCFAYTDQELRDALTPLFCGPNGPTLVWHNAGFDISFLARRGLHVDGDRVLDVLTAAQLQYAAGDFPDCSLAALAKDLLDITLDKSFQTSDWGGDLSIEQVRYAAQDARTTLLLGRYFQQEQAAERATRRVIDLEHRAQSPSYWMMTAGLPVDRAIAERAVLEQQAVRQGYLDQLNSIAASDLLFSQMQDKLHVEKVDKARARLKTGKFKNGVGPSRDEWNWASVPRVLRYLKARGVPLVDSTSENAIAAIDSDDPLLDPLLKWRAAGSVLTLMDNLVEAIADDGKVYAGFRPYGASTGRTAADKPNLQNLPHQSGIRGAVRPVRGEVMLRADYAQLQLVIIAYVTGDKTLTRLIREGQDAHAFMAARINDTTPEDILENHPDKRQEAKSVFFGFAFGAQAARYRIEQRKLGNMLTLGQAEEFHAAFYDTFPGIKAWHLSTPGWNVPIDIEDINGYGRRRRNVQDVTQKLNSPIQMVEANGLKTAFRRLYDTRERVPSARLVAMIHDEFLATSALQDALATKAWLEGEMEAAFAPFVGDLPIRAEARFVRSYADADKKGYPESALGDESQGT